MLFHVTHTHGYETCMAHDEDAKVKFSETISKKSEVKVHGVYADPPGHQIFMILEADTMEQLVKFLNPIIDFGDYNIRPILNFNTAIESLSNNLSSALTNKCPWFLAIN